MKARRPVILKETLRQLLPARIFNILQAANRKRHTAKSRFAGLINQDLAHFQTGRSHEAFGLAIAGNASAHGGELQSLIHYDLATRPIHEKRIHRVLEIGAAYEPGVALAFLLGGAEKVYANNIKPVSNTISKAYCENLAALMSIGSGRAPDWQPLVSLRNGSYELEGERFLPIGDRSLMDIEDGVDADLSVSFAVLEHIQEIDPFVKKIFDLTAPGGYSVHLIDMRDHSNFKEPIGFLELDDAEFYETWSRPYQSRRRISQYIESFEQAGFKIIKVGYLERMPTNISGNTEMRAFMTSDPFKYEMNEIAIWVTEEMRSNLVAPFKHMSLEELSVTVGLIVAKRSDA